MLLVPTSFVMMSPKASSTDVPASIAKGGGGGGPKLIDLVIADIWTSPACPVAGEPTTIYARVQNIGKVDIVSTSFSCILFLETMYDSITLTDLAAGEYVVWSMVRGVSDEGFYELRAIADIMNKVVEKDETNNERIEEQYFMSPDPILFDFESGPASLSDWTIETLGTGVVEVVADPASASQYSLHIAGAGYNYARATTPAIYDWNSYYDYTVTFKYYVTNSKWLVVYDDSRVVIEGRLDGLDAHLYAQIPYDPYEVDLGAVTHNEWHTIEIVVSVYAPAVYLVYIDGELRGNGIPLLNSAPGYNTFTVGSRDPTGSKDMWNAYWDDISIEQA